MEHAQEKFLLVVKDRRILKNWGCMFLFFVLQALAEEPTIYVTPTPTSVVTPTSVPSSGSSISPKSSSLKTKGKKVRREKEAEGTEAADRFEADTVIKSQYRLDGKSLEVDPD